MSKDAFGLDEIYQNCIKNKIKLPTVQRGFVWKPYQIEELWDSLLRGYPIGAIVLHPKKENGQEIFEVLDGQQRITAICLGMLSRCNDNTENKILKASISNIRIFIDLAKPEDDNDTRKYIFRVITSSHPWGYQRKDNRKTLEANNIRRAMNEYKIPQKYKGKNFYEIPLKYYYPFDAIEPYPWDLFINPDYTDLPSLKKALEEWRRNYWNGKNRVGEYLMKQAKRNDKSDKNKKIEFYTIEEIWDAIQNMRKIQKMPILYLDFSSILNSSTSHLSNTKQVSMDDIENLFIRLNTAGTPLSAEELNYSILKSHIDLDLQRKIESACKKLFKPARFIRIAYALFHSKKNQDKPKLSIKPGQFHTEMQTCKAEFKEFILDIIEKKIDNKKTTLEYIEHILTYSPNENPSGLPFIIVSRLSNGAPEIMFMLMYRIMINGDRFKLNSSVHRRMLGIITMFLWLGKGERLRDYSKLLDNIYPAMVKLKEQERFWSWETVQRAQIENNDKLVLPELLKSNELNDKSKKLLKELSKLSKSSRSKDAKLDNLLNRLAELNFFKKLAFNKDLLLFCQRRFLDKEFDKKIFMLDDTNIPFDYDHLFPQSYIKNKKGIKKKKTLKDWYNSIGNLRAWPYDKNREDLDKPPYEKLKDSLEDSCCSKEWIEYEIDGEEIKKKWKPLYTVYKLIIERDFKLCQKWYDELMIDSLFPQYQKSNLFLHQDEKSSKQDGRTMLSCLHLKKWEEEDSDDWNHFYKCAIAENIVMTIAYNDDELLHKDGIEFSLQEKKDSDSCNKSKDFKLDRLYSKLYNKLKESNKKFDLDNYIFEQDDEYCYLYSYFTLISTSKHSVRMLFKDIYQWLEKLDTFTVGSQRIRLYKSFKESIKKEFQPERVYGKGS